MKVPTPHYNIIPTLTSLHQDTSIHKYNRHTFIHREEEGLVRNIYTVLPNVGNYVLRIFIKNNSSVDSKTIFCTSYVICCDSELTQYCGFPKLIHQVAKSINFELLYWTGHVEQDEGGIIKSYIAECATGRMTLYFKTDSNSQLTHVISPGYFDSDLSSSHLYNFYTSLTPLKGTLGSLYYRLDVVFPLKGLWTICVMQRDVLNDAFNEPLLLYQVNVSKGIKNCTYPWIKSPQNVALSYKGPFTVLGNEVFELSFTVLKEIEVMAVLTLPSSSESTQQQEHDEITYEQFINLDKQHDCNYNIQVVFPMPGKWIVNIYQCLVKSTQQYSGLFSLYFDVPFAIDNAIFPVVIHDSVSLKVDILDSLPLYYDRNGGFKVCLSAPKLIYFNVKIFPTNYDHLTTSESVIESTCGIRDYWSYMEPLKEGESDYGEEYCLHVVFHELGQWSVCVSGIRTDEESDMETSMIQLYVFKLDIKSTQSIITSNSMLYPKLYPAYHDLKVQIPTISYCYHIQDKLSYSFTIDLLELDFNVVIFRDNRDDKEKFDHQALVYPDEFNDKKYNLEVIFPKKGNWIVQVFTGNRQNYRPVFGLYTAVKYPTLNYTYPWISPSFFKIYQMNLKSSSFLLPSKVSQRDTFTLTFIRPDNIGIIHQAKQENVGIIEGVTCLLQTDKYNEYILTTNFTTTGQWTLLLYAMNNATTEDQWSLVFVYNLTVF